MLGICKGLHYSLWMQDKLLLKEQTVARFCNILLEINDDVLIKYYIFAMFEILAREWDKLDNWRVDKFMLLGRDFFNHGLHHFTLVKPQLWDAFVEGLFTKIMNKDFSHAVGLKMHFCNLLSEELHKTKIKPIYMQSLFKSIASLLATLPKHNIYSYAVLKLINQLSNTLRRYPISLQEEVTAYLAQLISRPFAFRNALKSTNNNLKNAIARKQKLKLNKQASPKKKQPLVKSTVDLSKSPASPVEPASNLSLETPANMAEPLVVKKKKLKTKKKLKDSPVMKPVVGEKRKLAASPDNKPKKSKKRKVAGDDSADNLPTTLSTNKDDENMKYHVEIGNVSSPVLEKPVLAKTPKKLQTALLTPDSANKTPVPEDDTTATVNPKRRVSFGKVFRKKFDAARTISMTPPVNTSPAKGILRTKGPNLNEGRGRLSL